MNRHIVIFIFFCMLFISPQFVVADQFGCGDAQNPQGNRCCSSSLIHTVDMKIKNSLGDLFDPVLIPVNAVLNLITVPFNNALYDMVGMAMKPCAYGIPSTPSNTADSRCICIQDRNALRKIMYLCDHIQMTSEKDACSSCLAGGNIWSGMGCINSDIRLFIQNTLLRLGVGIAGGISLLCIMFAAFQMQTSGGNAEKLKKAQELLTNCITGLMVIIFSLLILKIIGVDILQLPHFASF